MNAGSDAERSDRPPLPPPVPPLDARTLSREPKSSGLAVASLVLSITWLCGLGSVLGLVLGLVARNEIEASGGALSGTRLATAGAVIGAAGVVVAFLLGFAQ